MIQVCLSVFDAQAQSFSRPMFVAARGLGLRAIADEVNRASPDNPLWAHTVDFRVFELGSWDDNSGLFQCHSLPQLVADCVSLKTQV